MSSVGELGRGLLRALPLSMKRLLLYLYAHRRFLPKHPVAFTEKIQWRILYDRRELIAIGGDKLRMKDHARTSGAAVLIPETLWSGTDLSAILHYDWQCEWVLKPIGGSGYAAFGSGSLHDSGISLAEVATWDFNDIHRDRGEWAYSTATPGFLIERRIPTLDGKSPNDYRFFVFDGQVRLVQVDTPRVGIVQRRFYTPDWKPLEVRQAHPLAPARPAPERLPDMVAAASLIGAPYDFIRVDLYDAPDGVTFGELTPYPTGGVVPFSDRGFDKQLGEYWRLPATRGVVQ